MNIDRIPVGIWRRDDELVLASTSQTRRLLLEAAGLPVKAVAPDVDERALEAGEEHLPAVLAQKLAAAKAEAVSDQYPDRIVVGADQVLALGETIFHKPEDEQAAKAHLSRLQGRSHQLHSAVAVVSSGRTEVIIESATLTMRELDQTAIDHYVDAAGDHVRTSVGGYQLEGLGIHLFERVDGDHTTILGLPMLSLLAQLRRLGALAF